MESTVGARVRAIRERIGMQAQELATKTGLDATVISKIENERRSVKSSELALLADALRVSPLALLEENSLLAALPVAARNAGQSITDGGAYDRLLTLTEYHTVLADAGIHNSPLLSIVPLVSEKNWFEGASELSEWAGKNIKTLSVGDQRLGGLADAIEAVLKIDVLVESFPNDSLSGAAITDEQFPLLFVNGAHPRTRCLFTLAHELGHLLARHGGSITLDRELASSTAEERMANAFAADFLMPKQRISEVIEESGRTLETLFILTAELGVSYESLIFRLHNLGYIDAALRDEFQALGWRRLRTQLNNPIIASRLPRQLVAKLQAGGQIKPSRRGPSYLTKRAFDGYYKGVFSIRPLANLLDEDPDLLLEQAEATDDLDSVLGKLAQEGDSLVVESQEDRFAGIPV